MQVVGADAMADTRDEREVSHDGTDVSGPIPIFVVGMTRSGTKWLSNLLSAHQCVAAVKNERHRGILETSIFDTARRKFELSSDDDYAAFIELWSRSDFFRAAGAQKELFYRVLPASRDYLCLFGLLMNDMARRRECSYWLQKVSPHCALPVLKQFPGARLVVIKRNLRDVIRSQAALNIRNGRPRGMAETVFDYAYQEKFISRLLRIFPNAAMVKYELLRENTDRIVSHLYDQLGLGETREEIRSVFLPNTSFPETTSSLPRLLDIAASIYAAVLRVLPLPALTALTTVRQVLRREQPSRSFYSGEFGLLKDNLARQANKLTE